MYAKTMMTPSESSEHRAYPGLADRHHFHRVPLILVTHGDRQPIAVKALRRHWNWFGTMVHEFATGDELW